MTNIGMFCYKCKTGTNCKSVMFGSKSIQVTCEVCGYTRMFLDIAPNGELMVND